MRSASEKITIRLPIHYLRELDFLVAVDDFPSRSEAIRTAVRDLLYSRVDMVIEKVKRLREVEKRMGEIEAIEKEYLQQ